MRVMRGYVHHDRRAVSDSRGAREKRFDELVEEARGRLGVSRSRSQPALTIHDELSNARVGCEPAAGRVERLPTVGPAAEHVLHLFEHEFL
jgi:hypothetical protein